MSKKGRKNGREGYRHLRDEFVGREDLTYRLSLQQNFGGMALGTRYPLKVTIIAAVGAMVGTVAAIMGFSAERKRVSVRSYQSCCCHRS